MTRTCQLRALVALVLAGTGGRLDAQAPAPFVAVRATLAQEWNAVFARTDGWIGGDGVYSTGLGRDRVLWLFGDSLLGKVKDGRRVETTMVNNTLAMQTTGGDGRSLRFIAGKSPKNQPAAFFTPPDGVGFFWPQAATPLGSRLAVFLAQVQKTSEPGAFGFRHVGQWLAIIENPQDEPERWRVRQQKLPFAGFSPKRERSWGAAIHADGAFINVFGYDEERGNGIGNRRLIVARVPATALDDYSAWRFWSSSEWCDQAEKSATLADGWATEFSVCPAPGGKGLLAVYTENGIGSRIVARWAERGEGPWTKPFLLYECPERVDRGVFCYSAKAHPWATTGKELLVSYCVNSFEFDRLFSDEKVYRPKFVKVELGTAR